MLKMKDNKIIDIMIDEFSRNWMDNKTFMKIFNISDRTALTYRTSKKIGHTKMFGKIWYKISDVQQLMNKNYNTTKK